MGDGDRSHQPPEQSDQRLHSSIQSGWTTGLRPVCRAVYYSRGRLLALPANGQIAVFLNQIPGFSRLPPSFQGVLRISSASMVAVNALRAHYNERGDFLISPTLPISEAELPNSPELLFPHFAIGGGCEMQFVLFSGRAAASSGTIYFFDQNGTPLSLALRL